LSALVIEEQIQPVSFVTTRQSRGATGARLAAGGMDARGGLTAAPAASGRTRLPAPGEQEGVGLTGL